MSHPTLCIETAVPIDEVIVSHTNLNGIITYANDTFAKISGYSAEELIGKPHNIVRHPDMPKTLFKNLWETLETGNIWSGYVKNLRKDGGFYWVFAQISSLYNKESKLIGYKSLRAPVEEKKKKELEISYAKLKEADEDSKKLSVWIDKKTFDELSNKSINENITLSKVIENLVSNQSNREVLN